MKSVTPLTARNVTESLNNAWDIDFFFQLLGYGETKLMLVNTVNYYFKVLETLQNHVC